MCRLTKENYIMRNLFARCVIVLPVLLAVSCASLKESGRSQAEAEPQFAFQKSTLENGMDVITLEDFSTPVVAVQVWYDVGSKDENPNRQGFAHMFEHMMFRGTDTLGPEEHFDLIRGTGGYVNAFTNFDYTAYVNTLPSNQLDLALWLEAERMIFLNVSQEGLDTERAVVEEERRMGLNRPYGTIFERIMPTLFEQHPYQWTPIGKIAHLRAAALEELQHFWDTYYVPSNATLVVVGAVSHEEAQAAAQKYFGWVPRLEDPPRVTFREPPQEAPREITISERLGRVPFVWYAFRGVPASHADSPALQLMLNILGSGQSSRLYQDLVKERKVCQTATATMWGFQQDGLLFLDAEIAADGDQDTDAVLALFDEHIASIQAEGVTDRELEKVKNRMLRSVVTGQLQVYNKADSIGRTAIVHGDADWLNQELAAIAAVTPEDIQRVASTYLVPERRTTVRVMPDPEYQYDPAGELKDYTPPERAFGKTEIQRPADYPTTPPLAGLTAKLPEVPFEETTLSNGLKVVVVPNGEVPFTTAMLGLKYGAWADDPAAPGVASMTMNMITQGTENYTAAELAETIGFNALTLGGSATSDVASVSATALTEKLPLALDLLSEVTRRPNFPDSELAILKDQLRNTLAVQSQDPSYQAERELRQRLYGEHPYARSLTGEAEDVDAIDREQLIDWWRTYVRPDAAVLYIAGDAVAGEAFELAEEYLGDWTADTEAPSVELPAFPEAQGTQIYLVDKPGAVQSQIRVAHRSINRHHPDYHKARVFSTIFGNGFNSRLNRVIRVERGLTYGARGYFRPGRFTGQFNASTFTKTETTGETVQAILDVIQSMRDTPPTEEEITSSRSYLAGSFPGQLETPQDTVSYQWIIEYGQLPKDYLQRAMDGYGTTTTEDVVRIAHDLIDTDNLVIVVVGQAEIVKESLEEIAPVTVISPGDSDA
jgi:zinc protease